MQRNSIYKAILLATTTALTACGGSSGGDSADDDRANTTVGASGYIVDTGNDPSKAPLYTGLTQLNGVIYASRVDTQPDGAFNSTLLRAEVGDTEFTEVQQVTGRAILALDMVTVISAYDPASQTSSIDELVVACFSSGDETTADYLGFYRDDDLIDDQALVNEHIGAFFNLNKDPDADSSDDFLITTCNDIAVVGTGGDETKGLSTLDIAVAGPGTYTIPGQGDDDNSYIIAILRDIEYTTGDSTEPQRVDPGSFVFSSSSEGAPLSITALEWLPRATPGSSDSLIAAGHTDGSQFTWFGAPLENNVVFRDYEAAFAIESSFRITEDIVVNEDANVFAGDDSIMPVSTLERSYANGSTFYAIHHASKSGGDLHGVATFDTGMVGTRTPTSYTSLGQEGLECFHLMTVIHEIASDGSVNEKGLCLDGNEPTRFITFELN
ncbi:hypothetical protein [Marinobacter zhejiangensis]|uniref:Uncharacterized protein n=1 Tax=Marinobacter zhejiangensis TaxID=488535 RepID=A0A1I4TQC9_9GAMM|nr:hypothetical protein [Marinobacter zhejiangensis]SFM78763.1 hypothetical protein SAMN04487963_3707 [Marinobacter zhejiangensis]